MEPDNKYRNDLEWQKSLPNLNIKTKENITELSIDHIKAKKQNLLKIQGIDIYFPYTPYQPQIEYMKRGNYNIYNFYSDRYIK
jgi:hypothetical protein